MPNNEPAFYAGGHYSFVSQFMTLNLPKHIVERLKGSTYHDDIEDAVLYSRLAHERTHFIQNFCTTYGIWKTVVLRMAGFYAFEAIQTYRQLYGRISVPFSEHLPRGIYLPSNLDNSFSQGIVAKQFLNWLSFMEDNAKYTREHFPVVGVSHPTARTNPMMSRSNDRFFYPLTAKDLLEFQARSMELNCLYNTKGIKQEYRDQIIPRIWTDQSSQLALRMSDFAFGDSRSTEAWLACLVLTEIALNPYWPCLDFKGTKPKLAWEQVHPGWRFVSLLKVIMKENITIPPINELNEFQISLCHKLSWPTPSEALAHVITDVLTVS